MADVVVAPAKLTCQPADHRCARRRLPPHRRRDGEPRPRRPADDQRGRRARGRRPGGRGDPGRRLEPRAPCARGGRPPRRTCGSRSSIPAGAGLGGGSSRRRGDPAVGRRATTSRVAASLGADVPFCLVGGRARVTGIGEIVEPLPVRRRAPTPSSRRPSASRPPRSIGRGTSSAVRSSRAERPRAGGARGASRGWRSGATGSRRVTGSSPMLAGSGSTWFVEGDHGDSGRRPRARDRRRRRARSADRCQRLAGLEQGLELGQDTWPPVADHRCDGAARLEVAV